jgi:cell division protein ZapA
MENLKEQNSIKVEIAGDTYLLKSDKSAEHVAAIARYVNDKIRTFMIKSAVKSPTKIAVLAALNIAEELFEIRDEYAEKVKELELIEKQSKETFESVDQVLERISAK